MDSLGLQVCASQRHTLLRTGERGLSLHSAPPPDHAMVAPLPGVGFSKCQLPILGGGDGEKVRVTSRLNRHDTVPSRQFSLGWIGSSDIPNSEELSGSGSKGDVGSSVEVDGGLGEHGVVL